MNKMRSAFTLVEVNLAIFIMATGVLAMVSLYSLGFRESRQSEEDVAATGFADAYLAPLVAGLSATNMTWDAWKQIGSSPQGAAAEICDGITQDGRGWRAYVEPIGGDTTPNFRVNGSCNNLADDAFNEIKNSVPSPYTPKNPNVANSDYYYGLVATRRGGTISLAFRVSRRRDMLMSQPVYYTEVHFQGIPSLLGGAKP